MKPAEVVAGGGEPGVCGVECSFAPRFGFPDRPAGGEQEIARRRRPRLTIEFDQPP